jgi:hypothetical protein
MMDGMNNRWGMGNGYSWIIGLIVLVVVIGLVFKFIGKNKK